MRARNASKKNRKLSLVLGGILLSGVLFFCLGFFFFYTALPPAAEKPFQKTEAIVVLTGSSDRLHVGLDLFRAGLSEKLFISGVHKDVRLSEILQQGDIHANFSCCVMLGYEAIDTAGNASETQQWIKSEGYTSLRLVTSVYHMPRSLLEFRRLMPELDVIAHPVFSDTFHLKDWWRWPGSRLLMLQEYTKYLASYARLLLTRSGLAYTPQVTTQDHEKH